MACVICNGFVLSGGNICAFCAATRNPSSDLKGVHEIGRRIKYQDGPKVAVLVDWHIATQQARQGTIEKGAGGLRVFMWDWVPHMVTYLTDSGYWDASAETNFGDQHTPGKCKKDTKTLDFQGVRKGSEGRYWIDIQAQFGKDNSRKTYGQVLIQCTGGAPPTNKIVEAMDQSLNNSTNRSVVHTGAHLVGGPT